MKSENVAFVSQNEGSDLGIPWPDGPPSSDCPAGWHADDAPRRHRVETGVPKLGSACGHSRRGFFFPIISNGNQFFDFLVASLRGG